MDQGESTQNVHRPTVTFLFSHTQIWSATWSISLNVAAQVDLFEIEI
jgi:hypothetical protein